MTDIIAGRVRYNLPKGQTDLYVAYQREEAYHEGTKRLEAHTRTPYASGRQVRSARGLRAKVVSGPSVCHHRDVRALPRVTLYDRHIE